MTFKSGLMAMLVAMAMPQMATATIVQTFATPTEFAAAAPHITALPLNLAGAPPVFVSSYSIGNLLITAQDAGLAGDGAKILSTELDSDVLVLDFANPIYGIGLFGGVTDFDFGYIDGQLQIDLVGSGTSILVANGAASYLGLLSDIAFNQVRISILSFDSNVSSVGFASLEDSVSTTSPAPEPQLWAMLAMGFGTIGLQLRGRNRHARVRSC